MDSYIKCGDCGLLKVHHNALDLIGWVTVQRRIAEKEIASLDFCGVDCMVNFVKTAYIENAVAND